MITTLAWCLTGGAVLASLAVLYASRAQRLIDHQDDEQRLRVRQKLSTLNKLAAAQVLVVLLAGAVNLVLEKQRHNAIDAKYGQAESDPGQQSDYYYVVAHNTGYLVGAGSTIPLLVTVVLWRRRAKLRLVASE